MFKLIRVGVEGMYVTHGNEKRCVQASEVEEVASKTVIEKRIILKCKR
jgi:hypothetical protein